MDGGPVANGCGYLGMVHAVTTPKTGNANIAMVTSAQIIVEFLSLHYQDLFYANYCGTKVVELPVMPFMNCNIMEAPQPLPARELKVRTLDSISIVQVL